MRADNRREGNTATDRKANSNFMCGIGKPDQAVLDVYQRSFEPHGWPEKLFEFLHQAQWMSSLKHKNVRIGPRLQ